MPDIPCETLIVGGGAAGLMAGIVAAERGDRVVLLEKNDRLGRKILISGNGRCNMTNLESDPVHFHGGDPGFFNRVLAAFPVEDTLAFFRDLGIETRVENRGRVFPASNQAASVADLLEDRARHSGVGIVTGANVSEVVRRDGFRVRTSDGRNFRSDRLVMTTGGSTAPSLGGSDDGIRLVCGLGHRRTPTFPGLVPLETERSSLHKLQGVRAIVSAEALVDGRVVKRDEWELLFRFYGLSGPVILNLSESLAAEIGRRRTSIRLSFFPGIEAEALDARLRERWERHPHRGAAFSFAGMLPDKIAPVLLPLIGVSPDLPVGNLPAGTRRRIAERLTSWEILILGTRPFAEAEVMVGGIVTEDVDPDTLESRLVPGLHLAGEMLDVHGDLGGYNFQWAWSSGWVAGRGGGPIR